MHESSTAVTVERRQPSDVERTDERLLQPIVGSLRHPPHHGVRRAPLEMVRTPPSPARGSGVGRGRPVGLACGPGRPGAGQSLLRPTGAASMNSHCTTDGSAKDHELTLHRDPGASRGGQQAQHQRKPGRPPPVDEGGDRQDLSDDPDMYPSATWAGRPGLQRVRLPGLPRNRQP